MLSILHAGRPERADVATPGWFICEQCGHIVIPEDPRFQVLLPRLPKAEASGLIVRVNVEDA